MNPAENLNPAWFAWFLVDFPAWSGRSVGRFGAEKLAGWPVKQLNMAGIPTWPG